MKRVLVTDYTFPTLDIERAILEPLGHTVDARQCRTQEELIAAVAGADAVVTQFAPVTAAVVAAMTAARVIVRYGIGVDNVDLEAARAKGVPVCNVPDYCIDEVAEHTLAFILGLTRQVTVNNAHVHAGKWGLPVPLSAFRCLRDLSVGVVGFGRIGREVVRRLIPFRCQVQVFDPVVNPAEIEATGAVPVTSLGDLLPACDVLTLHCPSNARTRKMVSAAALDQMRSGSLLVNLARGDLVDTAALVDALRSGRLAGAALDVCDPEPIPAGHPLLEMKNVILAPHLASASERAVRTVRETAARLVADRFAGRPLTSVVNGVPT